MYYKEGTKLKLSSSGRIMCAGIGILDKYLGVRTAKRYKGSTFSTVCHANDKTGKYLPAMPEYWEEVPLCNTIGGRLNVKGRG